jgi:prepilin-type N-terminal cleavage/methylation domain-containing protein
MRQRRRRGVTLVEVMISVSLSALVLTGSLATLYSGTRSWMRGQGQIQVDIDGSQSMRRLSIELREAMSVTVASDGLSLTYRTMRRDSNGNFVNPPEWDGVSRRARVVDLSSSGTHALDIGVSGQEQRLTRSVILIDPMDGNRPYRVFQPGSGTITRQLTVQIVSRTVGPEGEPLFHRTRETIFLRNIPSITQ